MGNVSIFSGRRAKLLSADGILNSNGSINDHNGIPNYITNGHAEVNVNGWVAYADTAAAAPVDGTGGSPTVTVTRTTNTPLDGSGSILFTKDAANRQGQGISFDFTVPLSQRSKVLQISADYIVSTGTFAAGSATTDSDITIWVYDVTNNVMIQPSTYKLFSSSSTTPDKFISNFQTSASGTTYRLIFHCATTSASAYSVEFDSVAVSPTTISYGTPITDWQSYTPTFTGFGTVTNTLSQWRRVGSDVELQLKYTVGTTTGVEARVSLPSGIVAASTIPTLQLSGLVTFSVNSTAYVVLSEPSVSYMTFGVSNANPGLTKATGSSFSTGATHSLVAKIPVQGWSAQVQSSDVNDQRIVAALFGSSTANLSQTSGSPILWPLVTYDTHAGYNTSTGQYRIPISGTYQIDLAEYYTNSDHYIFVYKNGVKLQTLANSQVNYVVSGVARNQFVAGDLITIVSATSNNILYSATNYQCKVSITRVANPSSITSTETVAAKYNLASGVTSDASNPVNYATREYDTHNAVTTGSAWKFTAPVAGIYSVTVNGSITSGAVNFRLFKNGVVSDVFYSIDTSDKNGSVDLRLNAGDFIDARFSSSATFNAPAVKYSICIKKIGI